MRRDDRRFSGGAWRLLPDASSVGGVCLPPPLSQLTSVLPPGVLRNRSSPPGCMWTIVSVDIVLDPSVVPDSFPSDGGVELSPSAV